MAESGGSPSTVKEPDTFLHPNSTNQEEEVPLGTQNHEVVLDNTGVAVRSLETEAERELAAISARKEELESALRDARLADAKDIERQHALGLPLGKSKYCLPQHPPDEQSLIDLNALSSVVEDAHNPQTASPLRFAHGGARSYEAPTLATLARSAGRTGRSTAAKELTAMAEIIREERNALEETAHTLRLSNAGNTVRQLGKDGQAPPVGNVVSKAAKHAAAPNAEPEHPPWNARSAQRQALQPPCREPLMLIPQQMVINEFEIGQKYDLECTVVNASTSCQRVQVVLDGGPEFHILEKQYPGANGLVAPGLSVTCVVRFTPSRYELSRASLCAQSDISCVRWPIEAVRVPAHLEVPTIVSLGSGLPGARLRGEAIVHNKGGRAAITLAHCANSGKPGPTSEDGWTYAYPFRYASDRREVQAGQCFRILVEFVCEGGPEQHSLHLRIVPDVGEPCVTVIRASVEHATVSIEADVLCQIDTPRSSGQSDGTRRHVISVPRADELPRVFQAQLGHVGVGSVIKNIWEFGTECEAPISLRVTMEARSLPASASEAFTLRTAKGERTASSFFVLHRSTVREPQCLAEETEAPIAKKSTMTHRIAAFFEPQTVGLHDGILRVLAVLPANFSRAGGRERVHADDSDIRGRTLREQFSALDQTVEIEVAHIHLRGAACPIPLAISPPCLIAASEVGLEAGTVCSVSLRNDSAQEISVRWIPLDSIALRACFDPVVVAIGPGCVAEVRCAVHASRAGVLHETLRCVVDNHVHVSLPLEVSATETVPLVEPSSIVCGEMFVHSTRERYFELENQYPISQTYAIAAEGTDARAVELHETSAKVAPRTRAKIPFRFVCTRPGRITSTIVVRLVSRPETRDQQFAAIAVEACGHVPQVVVGTPILRPRRLMLSSETEVIIALRNPCPLPLHITAVHPHPVPNDVWQEATVPRDAHSSKDSQSDTQGGAVRTGIALQRKAAALSGGHPGSAHAPDADSDACSKSAMPLGEANVISAEQAKSSHDASNREVKGLCLGAESKAQQRREPCSVLQRLSGVPARPSPSELPTEIGALRCADTSGSKTSCVHSFDWMWRTSSVTIPPECSIDMHAVFTPYESGRVLLAGAFIPAEGGTAKGFLIDCLVAEPCILLSIRGGCKHSTCGSANARSKTGPSSSGVPHHTEVDCGEVNIQESGTALGEGHLGSTDSSPRSSATLAAVALDFRHAVERARETRDSYGEKRDENGSFTSNKMPATERIRRPPDEEGAHRHFSSGNGGKQPPGAPHNDLECKTVNVFGGECLIHRSVCMDIVLQNPSPYDVEIEFTAEGALLVSPQGAEPPSAPARTKNTGHVTGKAIPTACASSESERHSHTSTERRAITANSRSRRFPRTTTSRNSSQRRVHSKSLAVRSLARSARSSREDMCCSPLQLRQYVVTAERQPIQSNYEGASLTDDLNGCEVAQCSLTPGSGTTYKESAHGSRLRLEEGPRTPVPGRGQGDDFCNLRGMLSVANRIILRISHRMVRIPPHATATVPLVAITDLPGEHSCVLRVFSPTVQCAAIHVHFLVHGSPLSIVSGTLGLKLAVERHETHQRSVSKLSLRSTKRAQSMRASPRGEEDSSGVSASSRAACSDIGGYGNGSDKNRSSHEDDTTTSCADTDSCEAEVDSGLRSVRPEGHGIRVRSESISRSAQALASSWNAKKPSRLRNPPWDDESATLLPALCRQDETVHCVAIGVETDTAARPLWSKGVPTEVAFERMDTLDCGVALLGHTSPVRRLTVQNGSSVKIRLEWTAYRCETLPLQECDLDIVWNDSTATADVRISPYTRKELGSLVQVEPCAEVLPPFATKTFIVRYTPSDVNSLVGYLEGHCSIIDPPKHAPVLQPLLVGLTASAVAPRLVPADESLGLPIRMVLGRGSDGGDRSENKSLALRNPYTLPIQFSLRTIGPFEISALQVTGSDGLAVDASRTNAVLLPGEVLSIFLRFAPPAVDEELRETHSFSGSIQAEFLAGETESWPLHGEILVPAVHITPAALDFGPVLIGERLHGCVELSPGNSVATEWTARIEAKNEDAARAFSLSHKTGAFSQETFDKFTSEKLRVWFSPTEFEEKHYAASLVVEVIGGATAIVPLHAEASMDEKWAPLYAHGENTGALGVTWPLIVEEGTEQTALA